MSVKTEEEGYLPRWPSLQRRLDLQLEGPLRRDGRPEARRLKAPEEENARLKRLLADAMLDSAALKDPEGRMQ